MIRHDTRWIDKYRRSEDQVHSAAKCEHEHASFLSDTETIGP
jgi:hypothetical protein